MGCRGNTSQVRSPHWLGHGPNLRPTTLVVHPTNINGKSRTGDQVEESMMRNGIQDGRTKREENSLEAIPVDFKTLIVEAVRRTVKQAIEKVTQPTITSLSVRNDF